MVWKLSAALAHLHEDKAIEIKDSTWDSGTTGLYVENSIFLLVSRCRNDPRSYNSWSLNAQSFPLCLFMAAFLLCGMDVVVVASDIARGGKAVSLGGNLTIMYKGPLPFKSIPGRRSRTSIWMEWLQKGGVPSMPWWGSFHDSAPSSYASGKLNSG